MLLFLEFEKSISHQVIKERFKIRAKSSYYQTLINLNSEYLILTQLTTISDIQLMELKRKTGNLLRLIDETGFNHAPKNILDNIQANIIFEFKA